MEKIYINFIKHYLPIFWVVVLSTALSAAAQQNEKQILPAENSIPDAIEAGTANFPVFIQSFTTERTSLTENQSVKIADLPLFQQQFSQKKEQLSETQQKLKSAKKMVTSVTPDYGDKDLLSVGEDKTIHTMEVLTSGSPIGTPDFFAVPTDQVLSIAAPGFLANDIDLDGEALSATVITDGVDNGTLTAFADGSFTYTPDAGFTGTDQFAYRMQNESGNPSDPVTVTIEVLPAANRNPIGIPDNYAMLAGTILSITAPGFLANDIDLDGETISATVITDGVDNGTLTAFANGSFTYTPDPGFTGTDQFAYRMQDAAGNQSDPVTVTIEVFEGNRDPIGVEDQYAAVVNTPLVISAPGFLMNDIDLDGDAISATLITDGVDNGILVAFANGSFTYTPDADFTGTDQFAYRMQDAAGNQSDPVTVTIVVSSAGTTPVGTPDEFVVPTDQVLSIAAPGFLANDIDLDGEALSATVITDGVDNGTLVAFANGSFTYTPDAGFTGTDQFAYRMQDGSGNLSDPVAVTIEVLPAANRNPIGLPDNYAMLAGTILSITAPGFLANDIDLDGETISATVITDGVDNGTLTAFANGSFTYTPDPGFTGTDQFAYRMQDAAGNQSDPVTVTIEVFEGNRDPIGVEDQYAAIANTPLVISAPGFLMNDIDLDGDAISATVITDGVDNGTLVAFADGSFTYTPDADFTGTDQFAYRMQDAAGNQSDPVTVTIEVYLLNQKPIADAGEDQTIECDGSELYPVILNGSNSSDPDSDLLTYTWRLNGEIIAGPSEESTAEIQLEPGNYEIELTVEDVHGETDTDIVTIAIEDTTPPTFTVPADITIAKTEDCTYDAGTSVTGNVTDEADNCDTNPDATFTDEIVPGECFGEEVITRTWTLTDDSGNSTSHVQIITVKDQIHPVIDAPEDYIICMEPFPEFLTATWTDNCSAGGELTATGVWFSETECTTTYAYSFFVTDDCGNEATETVYITRETEVFSNCETAYAHLNDESMCFLEDKFKTWGWTTYFEPSETPYTMDLFAGAGQCETSKGFKAGTVEVYYYNNEITVTYNLFEGYVLKEAHVYAGCDKYPVFRGRQTVAPGQYTYNAGKLDKTTQLSVKFTEVEGGIYLIAHATICEILCECSVTEYNSVSDEMHLGIDCTSAPMADEPGNGKKSGQQVNLKSATVNVYPNPFSDKLTFEFTANENSNATLVMYNALGQKVETLLDRNVRKGEINTVSFKPEDKVSGIYIYHLNLSGNIQTGKVIYHPGN